MRAGQGSPGLFVESAQHATRGQCDHPEQQRRRYQKLRLQRHRKPRQQRSQAAAGHRS